ncbi:MAG: DUF4258 domain-containing protein [bacterium]
MDKSEAKCKLQMMLLKGSLAYTKHANERMAERKFTAQDVIRALTGGVMEEGPTPTKKIQGFECVMRTQLNDGRVLEVPIVVDETAGRIIVKSVVRKSG